MRVVQGAVTISEQGRPDVAYQHSVLCQCAMPLRDPGDAVRTWDREQGRISMRIKAGEAKHPETGEWVDVGLPFGPNPSRAAPSFASLRPSVTEPRLRAGRELIGTKE